MSLPSETTGYLHQEVLRNAKYLVVTVDRFGLVAKQDCPGNQWRMEGLNTGRKLPDNLQGIIDASANTTTPQLYPYVQLTDTLFADVHVLNRGDEKQLILQDVSDGHGDEYKLQQKAHEVSLLLEQQAELNRELAEKRLEAEQASRAKSNFIASMSHEFRSPITAIMGHAEMLDREVPGSKRSSAIQRASWHLLTLVENLLEQGRTGEGILHLNAAPVDVGSMIDDMRELFHLQAESRGLGFEAVGPADGVSLVGDELRLRQVLINLISNAVRYTGEGSVKLSCELTADALKFAVADTGCGIAEQDQERVFRSFTRLGNDGGGAGLGLTISKQLVEAMGGSLDLHSDPGKGSIFSFSLPLNASHAKASQGSLAGVSILLVEDDDDLRDMYRIFMEDWGMRVTTVPGYRQAVEAFASHPADVVMADYSLGDGLGSDLLKELRALNPATGTVLCSGSTYTGDGSGFDPGCADTFVVKPISADYLKSTIQKTIQGTDT